MTDTSEHNDKQRIRALNRAIEKKHRYIEYLEGQRLQSVNKIEELEAEVEEIRNKPKPLKKRTKP